MKTASKEYIINTVFKTNVLPVSSGCNTSCVFCSHKQNPKGIEVFKLPEIDLEEFEELSEYLSPYKKIIIGEAATRIIEGEPFLNKNFLDILKMLRAKYKKTPIQITTNAILLDQTMIENLIEIGNVELNISVNCVNSQKRKLILGIKSEDDLISKIRLLKNRLKYSGSMVVVPQITLKEDIEEVVALLDENNAESVRVFLQGFTKLYAGESDFDEVYRGTSDIVDTLRSKYQIPIIIEPSVIKGLEAKVEGVIKGSSAFMSGIRTGDIIEEVNGEIAKSRVDAFNKVFKRANPKIKINRNGNETCLKLAKPANTAPGFAVIYDIDTEAVSNIKAVVKSHNAKNVLIITSELAIDILKLAIDKSKDDAIYNIIAAKNVFFGGNIKCAGLLTAGDIISCASLYLETNERPDLILLPPIMFDFTKKDLLGMNLKFIEETLNIPVDIGYASYC